MCYAIVYLCTTKLITNKQQAMEKAQENVSAASQLREMEVGSTLVFPAKRLDVVRVTAYRLGFTLDRRYVTRTNRKERTVSVTRTK